MVMPPSRRGVHRGRGVLARLLSIVLLITFLPLLTATTMSAANAVDPTVATIDCPGGGFYTVTNGVLASDWNHQCSGNVQLDPSVTSIPYVNFRSSAATITIPSTTTQIQDQPFISSSLETITVDSANQNYKSVDGVLYSKDGTKLILYPTNKLGESFTVPSGVVDISAFAFGCLRNLKHLTLPSSVSNAANINNLNGCGDNSLESYDVSSSNTTFSSVDGVLFDKSQSIQISYPVSKPGSNYNMLNSVTEIRSQTFSNARYLQSITLSDHLQRIGQYSFSSLNLATLNLPASLTTIDSLGLDSTKSVTLDSGNTSFSLLDGVLFNYNKSEIISYFNVDTRTSYTFPSSVTSSRNYVFGNNDGRNLKRLTINTTLSSAGVDFPPIKYLNLGSTFQSNGILGNWYFNSLRQVNYCGNDAPTINAINARLISWNHSSLTCVTSTPAFSLSSTSDTGLAGSPIRGYSIASSAPVDIYSIDPDPSQYGLTFNPATGLLSGTPYQAMSPVQFTITASNALGESSRTFTLGVQSSPSAPNAPTNVVARPTGYNSASVSFSRPTFDGNSAITQYVAISTPGGISASIPFDSAGPIAVSGLTPGTSYTFKVRAINGVGVRDSSPSGTITTNPYGVYHVGDIGPSGGYIFFETSTAFACASGNCKYLEAAPEDLPPVSWESATASALAYRGSGRSDWYLPDVSQLELMYTNLLTNGLGGFSGNFASGCRGLVYWSSTEIDTSNAYLKSFGICDQYWYTGPGSKSYPLQVRPVRAVATPTVAGAPTVGAISRVGVLSANVAFTPPTSDGGRAITSYRITSSPGGITTTASGNNNTIRVDGLSPATTYRFTMVAINEAGESVSSAQSNTYTTPAVPVIAAPVSGTGKISFNITGWSSDFSAAISLGNNSPGKISVDTSTAGIYAVTISDLLAGESVSPTVTVTGAGTSEVVSSANFTASALAGSTSFTNTLSVPSPDLQYGILSLSADGNYMIVADGQYGLVYLSTNGGKSWIPQYSLGRANWSRPAISSSGQYMAVNGDSTKIWVSTNFGATWSAQEETRAWNSVSTSAAGQVLVATTKGLNNIYRSANYGTTWDTVTATSSNWRYAASSADGTKGVVCADSDGIYLSTNSWATLNRSKNFSAFSVFESTCSEVAMSSNGSTIVVLLGSYGHMLISTNSGSTWQEITRFAGMSWKDLSISSDGTRISAIDGSSGNLLLSIDSGSTWQKFSAQPINSSAITNAGVLVALPKVREILEGKTLTGICSSDSTSLSTAVKANDGNPSTLFRCYTSASHNAAPYASRSAGLVTADVGPWVVTGISFTPGSYSNLDPMKFSLYGCTSLNSITCKPIVINGSTGIRTNNSFVKIRNSTTYSFYRVLFESIRGGNIPNNGSALELAEVSLFGSPAPITTSSNLSSISSSIGTSLGGSLPLGILPTVGAITSKSNGFTFPILNFDSSYSWSVTPTGSESATLNTATGVVTVSGVNSQELGSVMITATKQGYVTRDPIFVSGVAIAPLESTVIQGLPTNVAFGLAPAGAASSFDVGVNLPYSVPAGAKIVTEGSMTDRVDVGLGTVRLTLRDAANAPIETLADPVAITIPTNQGKVPVYSPDGLSWVAIPQLIPAYVGAVPTLPSTQQMGYYINSNGDTVILTRKL